MKYLDEYRDAATARRYARLIARRVTRPWTIMEVCGGQTHSILRHGLDRLLPGGVTLVHGPGCPVCVTPVALIDRAVELARRPGVVLCSFGDMLRVPGSRGDLFSARAGGGDVRVVYAPLDAVALAERMPDREVVFFAVGFETTAPANAVAVARAAELALSNFSLLVAQVLVPPAMEAILASPGNRVQGFLAPGHVIAVTGVEAYETLASRWKVPIVVTGFEPLDLLQGIAMVLRQLEEGRAQVENPYARAVRSGGNPDALALLARVFEVVPRSWRGIGEIPRSGLGLGPAFRAFDAERKFALTGTGAAEDAACMAGSVLRGIAKPPECAVFGTRCTPEHPLGAPMVSAEGSCAAYWRYRRPGVGVGA
ncbi:MAG: hydrogenase formation protein HypD [Candidatus Coatesbacteria bacterium]